MFIHCRNSKCRNYWEHSCMLNLNNKMVSFNEYGHCEDFTEGVNEARFTLDRDSVCYGCKYYGDEEGILYCTPPDFCIEGSMNSYKIDKE